MSAPAASPRIEAVYPLTPLQQGMLFHTLLDDEAGSYVVQLHCDLTGPLDAPLLRQAWQDAVDAHPILRTAFPWERRERPLQAVLSRAVVPWSEEDWRGCGDRACQERRFADLLAADRRQGFDLKKAPLLRLTLVRMEDERHRLLWTSHHLLLDGWSSALVLRDVTAAYGRRLRGLRPDIDPGRPFRDFVTWLGRQDTAAAESFWRSELAGFPGAAPLPLPRPLEEATTGMPAVPAVPGIAERDRRLPADLSAAVRSLAASQRLTESTVLLGAFAVLLARYAGRPAVPVGVTVSGRPPDLAGVEGMVGLFINTLPLVVEVPPAGSSDWLVRLQRRAGALQPWSWAALPDVRRWAGLPSNEPLFESLFVFENYPDAEEGPEDLGGLRLGDVLSVEQPDAPLTLVAAPGENLRLRALFDPARFEAPAVERLLGHLEVLLAGMAADPGAPPLDLPLLAREEERQILGAWHGERREYPGEGLYDLFRDRAARHPEAPAVEHAGRITSYGELDRRAAAVARALAGLGVRPGDWVAVLLERGADFLAAILGILRCGAAYAPLDPSYPAERLAFLLRDAAAPAVVLRGGSALDLPVGCRALNLDEIEIEGEGPEPVAVDGDWPAYVLYTSGSTGLPKGIAVPQRAVVRLVIETGYLSLPPAPRVAFASNVSFDASTLEIWAALLHGGCLRVLDRETLLTPSALAAALRAAPLDLLWLTAGVFNELARQTPDGLAGVDTLICGGDVVDPAAVRAVRAAGSPRRLLDGYGPTENTTFTAVYDTAGLPAAAPTVPIGRPITNTEVFVLDRALRPVPAGVPGELCAGGDGLAFGYHARPDLTAERFVPHPWSDRPGGRLYRTGDLVRFLERGDLEFVGRLDHQVKIRGFRVEPGEVEAALRRHPGVEGALVVPHDYAPGDRRLLAYVTGAGLPEPAALRDWLAARLPEPLVPAAVVPLPAFPLTPNGKVDRRALPLPAGAAAAESSEVPSWAPPAGESLTLQILAGIWSQVLQVPAVSPEDDFFALGGHSLLATVVLSRIRAAFGFEAPLRALFDAPRLADLAAAIDDLRRDSAGLPPAPPIAPVPREEPLPLSFAQQRLWFLDRFAPLSAAYHIPHALRLLGELDLPALAWSFEEIARRHEALRTVFPEVDGRPLQHILPPAPVPLPVADLSALPEGERDAAAAGLIRRQFEAPFDLRRGPLLRVLLLRLGDRDHALAVTLHHIAADGWSVALLAREMGELYAAGRERRRAVLPELPVQYADFAVWQRGWLRGEVLDRQLAYWRERLADLPTVDLPADRPRPAVQSYRGAALPVALPGRLAGALAARARREDATPFMLLLAAYLALLARQTGQADLTVGSPVAGRNRAEIEPLIGFFVNMVALRVDAGGDPPFARFLARARRAALDAYGHQDVPFEMLVETLRPERDPSRHPLFQLTFALHNLPPGEVGEDGLPGLALGDVQADLDWVRFDLELHLWPQDGGLRGYWAFATDLYAAATVARLHGQLVQLLEGIAADPEAPLSALPLLSPAERWQLLAEWNDTAAAFPAARMEHPVQRPFEELAAADPGRLAVLLDEESLTYGELDRLANRLAHLLAAHGAGPETVVGLLLERSAEMLAAMLAVVKAGAAYIPLDPAYPKQRVEYLLGEARPVLLLSHRGLADGLAEGLGAPCPVLALDDLSGLVADRPETPPRPAFDPLQTAYVIFTSGSTGLPKGVAVSHRALVNHMEWMARRFPLDPADRVFQKTTVTFDASVWEFWAPLLAGAPVVFARPGMQADPRYLAEAMERHGITVLQIVPSVLKLLAAEPAFERCTALRRLFVGGEAFTWPLVRRVRRRLGDAANVEVINLYGPAEATVDSTYSVWPEPGDGHAPEPIGLPVSNLRAHVLDRHFNLLPVGAAGELYLSGDSLARGYLHRPAQTAERFLPDPLSPEPGARLYRTGDLARRLPDGQLEYLGRLDHQVKIRGQRVELGEIEAEIVAQPGVRDALVTLLDEGNGDRRLVAYVVPSPEMPSAVDSEEERAARERARVEQWQSLYETIYRHDAATDPTFDIRGWNSSYTGDPLPAEEMRRWLDSTAARILNLRPRRVLEIGCGSGLILFAVAPHAERYLATDFSVPAVERLRRHVERAAIPGVRIDLEARPAHALGDLPPGSFDTVVLNSVVQYFPGVSYLVGVLEQAVAATAEGGAVFLGDLRSLPLLDAYHASVQLHQAPPELTGAELARRIDSHRRREEELALDPAFFTALRARLPRLRDVTVQLKRGGDRNELTRYRYDVVLHLDRPRPRPAAAPVALEGGSPEALARLLAAERPAAVRVERLENPRVAAELRLLAELRERSGDAARATAEELRERLAMAMSAASAAPDPEVYWRLGEEHGYQVEVRWAAGSPGELEVLLTDPAAAQALPEAEEAIPAVDLARLASDPLPGRWRRTFVPELRRRLEARLPGYMVPQALVCLEALPLTPNGKVDRAALPPPDRDALVSRDGHEPPATETERRLAEVWKGLLDVERVGRRDGFFDLGGHSLMVVMLAAAVRNELGVEVPVPRLFERTTLEAQAALVDELAPSGTPATPNGIDGIVTRLNGDSGRTVFCFPPLLGYGLAFLGIGRRIASHALWAFDFPEGDPDPLGRFARRVEEIQPEGPLVFLGYSAGGPVALEVARRLAARGRTVTDLILLDSAVVGRRPELSDDDLDALVAENLDYFEGFILRDPQLRQRYGDQGARAAMASRMRAYLRFLDRLEHPDPAAALNVHLIRSVDDNGAGNRPGERRDWRELVRGEVHTYQGAGRHVDMVVDENVDANAALVAGILDRLD